MFKKINNLLEGFLVKKNLKNDKERLEIEGCWEKNIDKKIKENATIIKYENGTLLIKAKNPTWKMELSFLQETIKKKLIKKTNS